LREEERKNKEMRERIEQEERMKRQNEFDRTVDFDNLMERDQDPLMDQTIPPRGNGGLAQTMSGPNDGMN